MCGCSSGIPPVVLAGDDAAAPDASGPDASASDAASDSPFSAGGIYCSAPLSSVCDVADASAFTFLGFTTCSPANPTELPGPCCTANPRAGSILGACGGYTVLPQYVDSDSAIMFMYPADGGPLAAVVFAEDVTPTRCLGGAPDFVLSGACLENGADFLAAFTGPGAMPGCSTPDAGKDSGLDAADGAQDGSLDAGEGVG